MRSRCEWKALVLAPGLEQAAFRAIEQLGRYFATPITSRFYKVRPETSADGTTHATSQLVNSIASANQLELTFTSDEAAPSKRGGELFDPGAGDELEEDRLLVEIATPPNDDAPAAAWFILELDAERWGGIPRVAERVLAWTREEIEGGYVLGARFAPKGGATVPGPQPPLAGDALVLAVDIANTEREYGALDRYLEAFDQHERFAKVVLVTRCLDSDLRIRRRRLLDSNGVLARISRPRRTLWIPPIPPPLGVPLERPDRPALKFVGTSDPGPIAEYTCSLTPQQHVHPAEIASLQALVSQAEALQDGRHVAGVAVLFDDETCARREMRPLRDVGVQVFVKDGADRRELTD